MTKLETLLLPFTLTFLAAAAACAPVVAPGYAVPASASSPVTFVAEYEKPIVGSRGDVIAFDAWGVTPGEALGIRFGNVPARVSAFSPKTIEVVVPEGSGTVDISVTDGRLSWVLVGAFRYSR